MQGQRSCGTSKSLGAKAEDVDEEKDDGGGQKEAAPPSPCDPPPTGVQATSLPSSKLYTACTYHLLLIHFQVTRLFAHHAQTGLPTPSLNGTHKHTHFKSHKLFLYDWHFRGSGGGKYINIYRHIYIGHLYMPESG